MKLAEKDVGIWKVIALVIPVQVMQLFTFVFLVTIFLCYDYRTSLIFRGTSFLAIITTNHIYRGTFIYTECYLEFAGAVFESCISAGPYIAGSSNSKSSIISHCQQRGRWRLANTWHKHVSWLARLKLYGYYTYRVRTWMFLHRYLHSVCTLRGRTVCTLYEVKRWIWI